MSRGIVVCRCLFLLVAWPLSAAPAADNPRFTLETSEGSRFQGPLVELRDNWTLRLGGTTRLRRSASEWLTLRRTDLPLPGLPRTAQVVLNNGDRIALDSTSLQLSGERLSFLHPMLGKAGRTPLDVATVTLVWLTTPETVSDGPQYLRRLLSERRRQDVIILRNGDVVEGVLERCSPDRLQVEVARRPVTIEMNRVAAFAFSSELSTPLRRSPIQGRLVLSDGSRLTLVSARSDDGQTLQATTASGTPVQAPLDEVLALDLQASHVLPLSEMKPLSYRHTSFVGTAWSLALDSNAVGGELRLRGNTYDRGLGMHSASQVTFAVPAGCRRLEALVGLDDQWGRQGSVRVRVQVDGQERDLKRPAELTARQAPIPVQVDVTGARQITLSVDFGAGGDVGDHVNWVDARLIR